MNHRETLDEAIDRVASRLTQSDEAERVEVQPVWIATPSRGWLAWRVAAVGGAAVVLLALAIMRTPRSEERALDPSVGMSALVVWSPLRSSVSNAPSIRRDDEPKRAVERPLAMRAQRDERPVWGIPFIEAPAALAVAATTMSRIEIDAVGVDAIELVPLSVGAIDRDSVKDSKEQ